MGLDYCDVACNSTCPLYTALAPFWHGAQGFLRALKAILVAGFNMLSASEVVKTPYIHESWPKTLDFAMQLHMLQVDCPRYESVKRSESKTPMSKQQTTVEFGPLLMTVLGSSLRLVPKFLRMDELYCGIYQCVALAE